mmetsp:Transcript_25899/g.72519  ORF Transcript_25899/g.72519 Transcript_25899/m.72519 type:complete len:564 (-) Transcript_25899:12-1703(-)
MATSTATNSLRRLRSESNAKRRSTLTVGGEESQKPEAFHPEPVREYYELIEPIGFRSKSVTVWRAKYLGGGTMSSGSMIGRPTPGGIVPPKTREVAVKIMNLDDTDASFIDTCRQDIQSMKESSHPNVVKYYCSFVHGSTVWLVMELMIQGSIEDIIQIATLEEADVLGIVAQVLRGLAYLHESGRIHRDIKARHILLNSAGDVKLSDFSVSASVLRQGRKEKAVTAIGSLAWMAPEVLMCLNDEQDEKGGVGYDHKADMWSLGITIIEMVKGKAPLSNLEYMKVVKTTLTDSPPILTGDEYSKALKDIVAACLRKEPSKRPSADEVLKEKVFKGVKKEKLVKLIKSLPPWSTRLVNRRKLSNKKIIVTGDRDFRRTLDDYTTLSAYTSVGPTDTMMLETSLSHRDPTSQMTGFPADGGTDSDEDGFDLDTSESCTTPNPNRRKSQVIPEFSVDDFQQLNDMDPIFELPISVHLGELPDSYVVYIRTVNDTELEFRLSEQRKEFTVIAHFPPLPEVEGIKMISKVLLDSTRTIRFPSEVAGDGITKVVRQGCMIFRIQKRNTS